MYRTMDAFVKTGLRELGYIIDNRTFETLANASNNPTLASAPITCPQYLPLLIILSPPNISYVYIGVDDCWAKSRAADGTIQADAVTFPSGKSSLLPSPSRPLTSDATSPISHQA